MEWGEREAIGRACVSDKGQSIYKFLDVGRNMMAQRPETKPCGYRAES